MRFAAFRPTLDRNDDRELGDVFEARERERFDELCFADTLAQISNLEMALDLHMHELARLTPT
jgi:hypothetical protein